MTEAQELSSHGPHRLVDLLAEQGLLTEPWLRAALAHVRRHEFLPDRVWLDDDTAAGGYALETHYDKKKGGGGLMWDVGRTPVKQALRT
ncbi:hypothetical protein ACH427_31985 [Streptomyces sp. NPDC020379]|uniref:hypothetical protein n=1 Tax=Streptomyces sp. NPDC020379 TaxID=3365071 RepID=UPI0037AE3F98